MANPEPRPQRPDTRVFASYPMPPKIDLASEQPRRESLLENRLSQTIPRPEIEVKLVNEENQITTSATSAFATPNLNQAQVEPTKATNGGQTNRSQSPNAQRMAAELAQKEARLMADIHAFQARPYSPYQVPPKIDLSLEQTAILTQAQNSPTPRPFSQASSTRSSTIEADLLDKEAKLMKDIEELERKPFNTQQMVLEREEWYEYPQGQPDKRQLAESKQRVRDFCTLPPDSFRGNRAYRHEENLPITAIGGRTPSPSPLSVHTAIIRQPNRSIDNKSPLPFAFDNFSTKGVRGNIASVGAVEPEIPRPPIYPIVRRSPTPNFARS